MTTIPELVMDETGAYVFCKECGVGLRVGHEHDRNYHFSGCRSLARER